MPETYEPELIIESGVGHIAPFVVAVGVALFINFILLYM
jgi:hypothetical protein